MCKAALPYRWSGMGLVFALLTAGCGSSAETTTSPSAVRCGLSISEIQSAAYPSEGGSGAVQITIARECAWSAVSDVSWVKLRSTSGQGDGVVEFTVDRNQTSASRSGGLRVNDQRRSISQQGTTCRFELSSPAESFGASGGERIVDVRASTPDCRWTAVSAAPWISFVGAEGTGDGQVTVRVGATTELPRTATIVIAGQQIQVLQSQAGGPIPGPIPGQTCSYVIVPDDVTAPPAGLSAAVQLSTGATCTWNAAANQSWLAIAPASGTGATRLQLTVAANAGPQRNGSASIGGRTLGVIQGNGCTYSVSPRTQSTSSAGGSGSFSVTTAPLCPWNVSGVPAWIQVALTNGAGASAIGFTASPNLTPARSAIFSVAGEEVTVNQPSQCTFELAPPFHEFDANGGNGNVLVIVSGACSWTASTSADWIKMTAGTAGTGNGLVQFVVPPNQGGARQAQIAIAGRNYAVSQAGR